jgi:hypothetical protein
LKKKSLAEPVDSNKNSETVDSFSEESDTEESDAEESESVDSRPEESQSEELQAEASKLEESIPAHSVKPLTESKESKELKELKEFKESKKATIIPVQWKVSNILTAIQKGDEGLYRKYLEENNNTQDIILTPQLESQVHVKADSPPKKRKYTKKSDKVGVVEAVINPSPSAPTTEPEIKDVLVTSPVIDRQYRDPKEIKAFQKAAEESKNNENKAAGYQVSDILTKDNLEKWIEQECRTYAWVAREKAGCPETQVAATAKMMGIKSKISKTRGIILAGK